MVTAWPLACDYRKHATMLWLSRARGSSDNNMVMITKQAHAWRIRLQVVVGCLIRWEEVASDGGSFDLVRRDLGGDGLFVSVGGKESLFPSNLGWTKKVVKFEFKVLEYALNFTPSKRRKRS